MTCFWAKKSEKTGVFKWLPLKQHLIDTMKVSGLLWEHWMSDGQKRWILKSMFLEEEEAKRFVEFLGAIHDIGKATPAFQAKISFWNSKDLDNQLLDKLEVNGFEGISTLNLLSPNKSHHAMASQALLSDYGVRDDICSLVGAHHGKPVDDKLEVDYQLNSYGANYFQIESKENQIHKKWDKAQKNIFKWALEQSGYLCVEDLPRVDNTSAIILSGLLIMADWIASNEEYFPLLLIDDEGESVDQGERLKSGWYKWIKTRIWEASPNPNIENYYKDRFNFSPREVQYKLSKAIDECEKPGVFILEAPMGVGKTEAALIAVEQLSLKSGRAGMFFGLPTQATSDGIFSRIKAWLERVPLQDMDPKSLQLVHGKAALNEDFSSLASNIDVDSEFESNVIVNEWFTGKKTAILDDFVVGTVDHFLLSALKQKHLALRHLGLSKKVVVIDEVHAYDAYMGQYLYRAIQWMGTYGVPVVILSATLPSHRRVELVKAYARGSGYKIRDLIQEEGWESTSSYPLITYLDGNKVKCLSDFKVEADKLVKVRKIDDSQLVSILEEFLSEGGIAGVIVNTVKRAQRLAKELSAHFGEEAIELLHSSFISTHRRQKEKELLNIIGKDVKRPRKKIIIGTQVIEQSLDIDFDLLISDLAPMDLLLQRVGRLHRHSLPVRPEKVSTPTLFVIGTEELFDFQKGSSYVYGEYLLIRTQYYLPDEINLPNDISALVQKVYDERDIELEGERRDKYLAAKEEMKNLLHNKKEKAKSYLLDIPRKSDSRRGRSLIGWLRNVSPASSDERGFAQVRDSADSIEVIALKKHGSGYSFMDKFEDISTKIHEFDIGKKIALQTLKLPNILSANFNIDKTIEGLEEENRRKLSSWQQQPWLKGSLGIIFDENNCYELNGWRLHYDSKYGLEYEKVVEDEKI